MRSNLSVGLPLDLLCYEADKLAVTRFAMIDAHNEYFGMIHDTWGEHMKQIFQEIPDPKWDASGSLDDVSTEPTRMAGSQYSTQSEARQPRAAPVRARDPERPCIRKARSHRARRCRRWRTIARARSPNSTRRVLRNEERRTEQARRFSFDDAGAIRRPVARSTEPALRCSAARRSR